MKKKPQHSIRLLLDQPWHPTALIAFTILSLLYFSSPAMAYEDRVILTPAQENMLEAQRQMLERSGTSVRTTEDYLDQDRISPFKIMHFEGVIDQPLTAEDEKKYGASGTVYCKNAFNETGFILANGFLLEHQNIIMTNAHVMYKAGKPLVDLSHNSCVFMLGTNAELNSSKNKGIPIVEGLFVGEIPTITSEVASIDRTKQYDGDWLTLRLAYSAPTKYRPYLLADRALVKRTTKVVSVVNHVLFDPTTGRNYLLRSKANCHIYFSNDPSIATPNQFINDCPAEQGASGSAFLIDISERTYAIGIETSGRLSADVAALEKGDRYRTYYKFDSENDFNRGLILSRDKITEYFP